MLNLLIQYHRNGLDLTYPWHEVSLARDGLLSLLGSLGGVSRIPAASVLFALHNKGLKESYTNHDWILACSADLFIP